MPNGFSFPFHILNVFVLDVGIENSHVDINLGMFANSPLFLIVGFYLVFAYLLAISYCFGSKHPIFLLTTYFRSHCH